MGSTRTTWRTDGAPGEDPRPAREFRCWRLHWHVHLASRRAHGGALLRHRGLGQQADSCRARCSLQMGSSCFDRPGVPGEPSHSGCVARPHFVGTDDTPSAVQSAATNTLLHGAPRDPHSAGRMHVRSRRQRWLGHRAARASLSREDLRDRHDRPLGHLRRYRSECRASSVHQVRAPHVQARPRRVWVWH